MVLQQTILIMKTNRYFIILMISIAMSCKSNLSNSNPSNTIEAFSENKESILIESKTFDKTLDFTSFSKKVLIGKSLLNTSIRYDITFVNCVFNKPVLAYKNSANNTHNVVSFWGHVNFIDCKFMNTVNFRASKFLGQCNFTKSEFFNSTNFEETSFSLNAYFNWSVFEKDVRFQNSFFNQKASFMNTTFSKNVSFQSSIFNSDAQFSASKFYNYTDFSLTQHRGNTFYNFSEFFSTLDISYSIFINTISLNNSTHTNTTLKGTKFMGKTDFIDVNTKKGFNSNGSFFLFERPNIDTLTKNN